MSPSSNKFKCFVTCIWVTNIVEILKLIQNFKINFVLYLSIFDICLSVKYLSGNKCPIKFNAHDKHKRGRMSNK